MELPDRSLMKKPFRHFLFLSVQVVILQRMPSARLSEISVAAQVFGATIFSG